MVLLFSAKNLRKLQEELQLKQQLLDVRKAELDEREAALHHQSPKALVRRESEENNSGPHSCSDGSKCCGHGIEPVDPFLRRSFANASSDNISISSTATLSDCPGAGRFIGNIYSRAGRELERCAAKLAHRCGYGPYAVFLRMQIPLECSRKDVSYWFDDKKKMHAADEWNKLLDYVQTGTARTRIVALENMLQLYLRNGSRDAPWIQYKGFVEPTMQAISSSCTSMHTVAKHEDDVKDALAVARILYIVLSRNFVRTLQCISPSMDSVAEHIRKFGLRQSELDVFLVWLGSVLAYLRPIIREYFSQQDTIFVMQQIFRHFCYRFPATVVDIVLEHVTNRSTNEKRLSRRIQKHQLPSVDMLHSAMQKVYDQQGHAEQPDLAALVAKKSGCLFVLWDVLEHPDKEIISTKWCVSQHNVWALSFSVSLNLLPMLGPRW